jgi:hypothetical protein
MLRAIEPGKCLMSRSDFGMLAGCSLARHTGKESGKSETSMTVAAIDFVVVSRTLRRTSQREWRMTRNQNEAKESVGLKAPSTVRDLHSEVRRTRNSSLVGNRLILRL